MFPPSDDKRVSLFVVLELRTERRTVNSFPQSGRRLSATRRQNLTVSTQAAGANAEPLITHVPDGGRRRRGRRVVGLDAEKQEGASVQLGGVKTQRRESGNEKRLLTFSFSCSLSEGKKRGKSVKFGRFFSEQIKRMHGRLKGNTTTKWHYIVLQEVLDIDALYCVKIDVRMKSDE